jgi:hypothetical protein
MGMVFCRGCGKEIHETAHTCPFCGATQGLAVQRNVFILILISLGWSMLFWIGFLFIGGMFIGVMNPENAEEAGALFGESVSIPSLLIAFIGSGVLTYFGKLPGTYKIK